MFQILLTYVKGLFLLPITVPFPSYDFNLIWKNSKFVLILSSIHSQHKFDALCNFMEILSILWKFYRLIVLLSWHSLIIAILKNGEENNCRCFFFSYRINLLQIIQYFIKNQHLSGVSVEVIRVGVLSPDYRGSVLNPVLNQNPHI